MQSMNGRRRAPVRRRSRGVLLLAAGLVVLPLVGCATKRDVKDVRAEIVNVRARQDTIFLALTDQNRAVRDSVFELMNELIRTRGDIKNQILSLEQQLIQIQELAGQTQREIGTMKADLARRQAEAQREMAAGGPGTQPGEQAAEPGARQPVETAGGANPEQLFAIGQDKLQSGAASTARMAFQQIIEEFPTHPRAADAQFFIGETYYMDQRYQEATEAFEQVVQRHPSSPRAPGALYRAGVIAEERGNFDRAREYFRRIISGWPRTDEARLAEEKLARLPNR